MRASGHPDGAARPRVLVRVQTTERHRESASRLEQRLEKACGGADVRPGDVGWTRPFQRSELEAPQFAVCWVRREVWDVLVHGAIWVSFAEQGLATPEVFAEDKDPCFPLEAEKKTGPV